MILCLNETKIDDEKIDRTNIHAGIPSSYAQYWNCCKIKKGYSGTMILTKVPPLSVTTGMSLPEHDREGRVQTAEFADLFLVNCYTPNSQRELARLAYRQRWDAHVRDYLLALASKKPVLFCGDLNVAHQEIDLANPRSNRFNPGFSDEERASFTELLGAGFTDTFRHFHPDKKDAYSWWSFRGGARERNVGWRIDYFGVSSPFMDRVASAEILPHVTGSDHCPVGIVLK